MYQFPLLTDVLRFPFFLTGGWAMVWGSKMWADRFVRESWVNFVLPRCFLMRSRVRVFSEREPREREREREKRRKEKKSNFYSNFFFDEIFYFILFYFWLRGTYINNAIHTKGETITNNSYNSNITNPNQVRIN